MKKLIAIGILCMVCQFSYAQYALSKGQAQFNAGLGFSSWGLPVYAGFDVGVHRDISVGGELSFRSYHNHYNNGNDKDRYHHSIFGMSGNGNYHFNSLLNIPREWDFYAGLNLGFYFWDSDDDYPGAESSGLELGAQVGGRYYFTEKFGLNLEVGGAHAFSGGKFGITLKI
jgi:outer membrane immunogenic protein